MTYFISFLEGIITFISPCLLPMLPVYLSYFAGDAGATGASTRTGPHATDDPPAGAAPHTGLRRVLKNALGFILGFTLVFIALGALAGTLGSLLTRYQTVVNIVSGLIVILFGLSFMDLLPLNLFHGMRQGAMPEHLSFFSAMLFGIIFSVSWTPCVGAFLGSALMLASQQGHVLEGVIMLLCYSLGLGIPFLISAVLIDTLKNAFQFIKRNYKIVNRICGSLLIIVGILMMTGMMGRWFALWS